MLQNFLLGQSAEVPLFTKEVLHLKTINSNSTLVKSGRGSSTAVERTPHNQEVVGSNPAGCWAFFFNFHIFLLSFTSVVIYQVPHGVATLTEHAESNKAASCKTGSIGSD